MSVCGVCKQSVDKNALTFYEKLYHKDCFACNICHSQLEPTTTYTTDVYIFL